MSDRKSCFPAGSGLAVILGVCAWSVTVTIALAAAGGNTLAAEGAGQPTGNTAQAAPGAPPAQADEYVGEATCLTCHEDKAYGNTRHGLTAIARSPAATHGCESCHGTGKAHYAGDDIGPPARLTGCEAKPIAVVGMGCRFPKAPSPDAFWELLARGENAITEIPPERWDADSLYSPVPRTPGRMSTRWGGFLEDVDLFDPAFFKIMPREAGRIDPQHRLVLEVPGRRSSRQASIPRASRTARPASSSA